MILTGILGRPGLACESAIGIDHTVLHVKDVAKSRKFYLDVLGMTVNHEDATHAFLWCGGGQMVALFQVG